MLHYSSTQLPPSEVHRALRALTAQAFGSGMQQPAWFQRMAIAPKALRLRGSDSSQGIGDPSALMGPR